jgi:hypothetical protein
MTAQLSWLQASRLNVGDRVVFVDPHDIFPEALVPAGTRATVTEQGLNEIWSALAVKPDDTGLQTKLAEWDGEIILYPPLDREGSGNREPGWSGPSPLAMLYDNRQEKTMNTNTSDAAKIADAFRQIYSAAMVINEVLGANETLNDNVPMNWPLNLSADEFAAECAEMVEHYDALAKEPA